MIGGFELQRGKQNRGDLMRSIEATYVLVAYR